MNTSQYDESDECPSEGSLGSLYEGHEVVDEMVIGPVEIWKPITLKFLVPTTEHKELAKKKEGKKTYSCEVCKTENTMHYTCAQCDKQFFLRMAMIAHLRKHKRSKTTPHLRKHRRSKNICRICKKEFKSRNNLERHMIKHSNLRPFICNICNKGYKSETTLMTHKYIHEERKPFKCEQCSKSFKVKGQLQVHARLHTGQKPYKCNVCSRQFAHKTSLNNHLLKHQGVKPHRCEFCSEEFRQISNLKQHLANKHPDQEVSQSDDKKVIKSGVQKWEKDENVKVLTWRFCKK